MNNLISMNNFFFVIMFLNVLWFGSAFWFFGLRSKQAANLLLPKLQRNEPGYSVLAYSLKFLGGLNLAMAALSIVGLTNNFILEHHAVSFLFLLVIGLAHGSQFGFNLPIAIKAYKKQIHLWPVLNGPMFFIFIVDGTLCALNIGMGGFFFLSK